MNKKKILYFHHAIGLGGAPKSLSLLIAGLDKDRFEPFVCMPKRPNNEAVASMFANAGAEVIEERDIRPFNGSTVAECSTLYLRTYAVLAYPKTDWCARKVTRLIKPDLVHLNSTCLVAAAKGAHKADSNVPVIAHVREPLLQNWWGRILARLNLRHVDHFVSIDQYGLQSIGGDAGERGSVVFNFVDRSKFLGDQDNRSETETNQWAGKTVFLSLSRIAPFNGSLKLATLLESVREELNPNAIFVFAGFHQPLDDYSKRAAESIDRLPNCSRMEFVDDPISLIKGIDVIVAPFLTPHSARSVLEGAVAGKPALVSNLPNLVELIDEGETGIHFDFDDRNSFVSAVNRLCELKERKKLGEAASQFAAANFDQQMNVARTISVYDKLLSRISVSH